MSVVSRGIQITRAVKNVGRLRQILGVFSRKGFGGTIDRLGLGTYLPNRLIRWAEADADKNFPIRLREAFEELGPTFVKMGQILSMRPDIVPEAVILELVKLQDNVQTIPFDAVKKVVETELGRPLSQIFSHFDEKPLASASIGQVHVARLPSGEEVVVKVQRPEIDKIISNDIALLSFIAELLEKYFPELRVFSPKIFVEEFFKSLAFELDYKVEANNIAKIGKNLEQFEDIVLPKVYREFSTHKVLVLERFHGIRVSDINAVQKSGIDLKKIAALGARGFLYSVLKFGVFHGDLHGGNLFLLPGDKLGLIDFGIVGRLSRKSRDQLATMIWAIIQEDYETLCFTYAELGSSEGAIDFESFQREVRNTLSPYLGLNLSEVNSGKVLIEATKIAAKYQIRVPGDWMLVFKAIVTMEGMGRYLDPEFDIINLAQELIGDIISIQYSPERLKNEAMIVLKDFASLFQTLPRQARWWMRKVARNDYALEWISPDVRELSKKVEDAGQRVSSAIIAFALILFGAVVIHTGAGPMLWDTYPALGIGAALVGLLIAWRGKVI